MEIQDNVSKAREIANEYCYWDDRDESGAVKVAIEMAEWKDEEFQKQKQDILDKACKWLESVGWEFYDDVEANAFNKEDIKEFRKYMEDNL